MLRRLHPEQPDSFAFTPANQAWAEAQMTKYPEGRQASAIIPILWRAQEQEGWLSRPAIEYVAELLDLAYIRALEVASFYFMFQLQPVGTVAHIQVCGTLSCMICGAEDLIGVCKEKIAKRPHQLSEDGRFSWEEVECLGACSNAPMAQIGKDYYEDLTAESFAKLLDDLAADEVPVPGPLNGRYAAEPSGGLTSLTDHKAARDPHNASAALAVSLKDTIKRIDGSEVPLITPWTQDKPATETAAPVEPVAPEATPERAAEGPTPAPAAEAEGDGVRPEALEGPRGGEADDLKTINGIGPALEKVLNDLGIYHFDQIAAWSPEMVHWVDNNMVKFKGRATRDDWVGQAKALTEGKAT